MPKLSLSKSIEARKLNKRTGSPESGTETTIPYGALIEHLATDREIVRFSYLGEHYRCAESVWNSAAQALPGNPAVAANSAAAVPEPHAGPPAPRLRWETVASTQHSVSRAKIPGGWLVTIGGSALAFVPDADHAWDGTSPD